MLDWLKRFVEDLQIRNKSRKTIQVYQHQVRKFVEFHGGRTPQTLGSENVKALIVLFRGNSGRDGRATPAGDSHKATDQRLRIDPRVS